MKFIRQMNQQGGHVIGYGEDAIQTDNPLQTCADIIARYRENGVIFTSQSDPADNVLVGIYEAPDNWAKLAAKGESFPRTPLATMRYDKKGMNSVHPPILV